MKTAPRSGLTPRQSAAASAFGAGLWLLAAVFIHAAGPLGALTGWGGAVTYALVIPLTAVAILILRRLAALQPAQTLAAVVVATLTAALLDAAALNFAPRLYGETLGVRFAGSAALLWGIGVALVLGIALSPKAARTPLTPAR
jgi:hypothetical protein